MNKKALFGFWFHHANGSTFIIDGSQIANVNIPYRDRFLSTDEIKGMMLLAAAKYDAVYFEDCHTTVEPVVLARSAPRFVIMESLKDKSRFAKMFDPHTGYDVCSLDGEVVNAIVSFADSSLELNELLHNDANYEFPRSTLRKALKAK